MSASTRWLSLEGYKRHNYVLEQWTSTSTSSCLLHTLYIYSSKCMRAFCWTSPTMHCMQMVCVQGKGCGMACCSILPPFYTHHQLLSQGTNRHGWLAGWLLHSTHHHLHGMVQMGAPCFMPRHDLFCMAWYKWVRHASCHVMTFSTWHGTNGCTMLHATSWPFLQASAQINIVSPRPLSTYLRFHSPLVLLHTVNYLQAS